MPGRAWLPICAGLMLVTACGRPQGGAAPRPDDRTDPALTSALDDQILVDPTLGEYSNLTTVRTTENPGDAPYPIGRAPLRPGSCEGTLTRGAEWANRLPATFKLPDAARLAEAAGKSGKGCGVQIAYFHSSAPPRAVLDWFWTRAVRDEFGATQLGRGTEQVLYGAKGGTSYLVVARPAKSGSEVGLVVRSES